MSSDLDHVKFPMTQITQRTYYFKSIIIDALGSVGVPESKTTFVEKLSYQFSKERVMDQ